MFYKCDNCGKVLDTNDINATKEQFKTEIGQSMWLTHFDCPGCKETIFCQIDSAETNALLLEVSKTIGLIVRCKRAGKNISKKLQSKYEKKTSALREARSCLVKQYNNQMFIDENGHKIKVRLKYEKGSDL